MSFLFPVLSERKVLSNFSGVCPSPLSTKVGQLYTWRRRFRTGELTGFAAVRLAPPVEQLALAAAPVDPVPTLEPDRPTDGIIEVELPSGVKLRLSGAVDEVALRRVLSALS